MEVRLEDVRLLEVEKPTFTLVVQVGGKINFGYIEFYILADSREN